MHHEPGRRVVGHDPSLVLLLCEQRHTARHDGLLGIAATPSGFAFSLADGTSLGSVTLEEAPGVTADTGPPARVTAGADTGPPPQPPCEAPAPSAARMVRRDQDAIERDAVKALMVLELPKKTALDLVRVAAEALASCGVPLTESALIFEALRSTSPGRTSAA